MSDTKRHLVAKVDETTPLIPEEVASSRTAQVLFIISNLDLFDY